MQGIALATVSSGTGTGLDNNATRDAESILMLVDCGRSNSAAKYIFKHDLLSVVNAIGVEIRVAHYPSYCSKYNPIERRFFPHVSRVCTGMLFDTLDRAVKLMRKASTSTGLRTTVNVIRRIYETGHNATRHQGPDSIHRLLPQPIAQVELHYRSTNWTVIVRTALSHL